MFKHLPKFFFLFSIGFLTNCQTSDKATTIIEKSIQAHGGEMYQQAKIDFDFREKHYQYINKSGRFEYSRTFKDSAGQEIQDILTNEGLIRTINGKKMDLTEEEVYKYSYSLNSVIYFMFLPFKLRDPAVVKEYLGEESIKGKKYHKILVYFKQEGGGEDFQDKYVYWINTEDFFIDYFAYSYIVNKGGTRFRAAFNRREVEGITFQDYHNLGAEVDTDVKIMGKLFEKGELKEISEIENVGIEVEAL